MWVVSIVSLSIVAVLCIVGIFHRGYRDNLLQCIGMAGLCYASCSRVENIWLTQHVVGSWMLIHVSIAIYGLGAGWEGVLRRGRELGWGWLRRLDQHVLDARERRTAAGDFDPEPHHWPERDR